MTTVTAAIDGSASSDAVIESAISIATLVGDTVEAFHIAGELDEEAAAAACRHRIPMTHLDGDPEEEVIRRFEEIDVRIAVIGARGAPLGALPAGHLACRAIQKLRVPLLVVPPLVSRPLVAPGPAVVPLDGTHDSADAVRPILEVLRRAAVDLVVLHAFSETTVPPFWDRPAHESEEWGREFRRTFVGREGAFVDLARGQPGAEILRASAAHQAVLLVLAWACDLGAGRAATIRSVLAETDVPVMLVPTARA